MPTKSDDGSTSRRKPCSHPSINTEQPSIRLLKVKPRSWRNKQPLNCLKMESFPTSSCPKYVAVSYMWGPKSPTRTIQINGDFSTIRQNLFNFLETFARRVKAPTYLWIDQLCIDQQNVSERNTQVQRMGQIFAEAEHVIAWVGPSSGGSDEFLEAISWCDKKFSKRHTAKNIAELNWALETNLKPMNTEAGAFILERQYWRRLWVVQEILHARQVEVMCGFASCKAEELAVVMTLCFGNIEAHRWHPIRHRSSGDSTAMTLAEALNRFVFAECEDPRDKIFGLASIIRIDERPSIDYSKTAQQVFVETCCALVDSYPRRDVDGSAVQEALRRLAEQAEAHVDPELATYMRELAQSIMIPNLRKRNMGMLHNHIGEPAAEQSSLCTIL